jgi:NADH dehydrogenase
MEPPRSSAKLVTVFGGSGFIGRYVVQALVKRGHRVRVAVRRPDLAGHVQPLGSVGQIKAIQANLRYRWSIERALEGADAVVNLVGILFEAGRQTFDAVQAFGPRAIGEAASAAGIADVVHVSAIGADQPTTVGYLRSKAEGEQGLIEALPEAVIMRPSIVFGPEERRRGDRPRR